VLWDHSDEVLEVSTEQPGVNVDVDTPEEYHRLFDGKPTS
jgi:hypothetical protein